MGVERVWNSRRPHEIHCKYSKLKGDKRFPHSNIKWKYQREGSHERVVRPANVFPRSQWTLHLLKYREVIRESKRFVLEQSLQDYLAVLGQWFLQHQQCPCWGFPVPAKLEKDGGSLRILSERSQQYEFGPVFRGQHSAANWLGHSKCEDARISSNKVGYLSIGSSLQIRRTLLRRCYCRCAKFWLARRHRQTSQSTYIQSVRRSARCAAVLESKLWWILWMGNQWSLPYEIRMASIHF